MCARTYVGDQHSDQKGIAQRAVFLEKGRVISEKKKGPCQECPRLKHLLVSTILPDVFTITFPSISQSPFQYSIHFIHFLLGSTQTQKTVNAVTKVTFKSLTEEEINYYIDTYQPFDKAGAYGIQEWIGQIGITSIEGSYTNVVGLPTHLVYKTLNRMAL